jgi:hypothetical protein
MTIRGWKQLEDAVWAELKLLVAHHHAFAHRFYDSRSAGASMPSQPSDFMFILGGKATFIECKFSEKHKSLRSCFSNNVDNQQIASAKLVYRAGAFYYVLFAGKESIELWSASHLIERRSVGKPLLLNYRHTFPSVKEAIQCLASAVAPVSFSTR